ncbi:MAG: hypothetical protein JNK15_19905 [Planctomycetes bacterium]|nr:hypothetical protein [Planctomycetota bacterium]
MNKFAALLFVALPMIPACRGASYRAEVGPYFAQARGDVALQNAGGTLQLGQNQQDLERNLGLGDNEVSPYVRLQADKDKHRVRLHGFGVEEDGSGVLTSDYGGIVAGASVQTNMDLYSIAASWSYQVWRGENYRVGLGGQAGFYSLDVAARSAVGREEVTTSVLVPMPFVEAEWMWRDFTVGANAALMSADLGDASGRYLDLEGYGRWQIGKDFDVFAGYRYFVLDGYGEASSREFDADVDVHGWFFGAGVKF